MREKDLRRYEERWIATLAGQKSPRHAVVHEMSWLGKAITLLDAQGFGNAQFLHSRP